MSTTHALRSIHDLAADVALQPHEFSAYGAGVAKLTRAASFLGDDVALDGKLVLVSAINPTPAGEGKTTVTIGLTDGLRRRGMRAVAALRQPSLGPTLGSKGGGAGGGRSRLEPFSRVNLGLTGDIDAVTAAHNLLASLCDNVTHFGGATLDGGRTLDARRIDFPRVLDLDDRSLRQVMTSLGGVLNGVPREGRFDITAASEVMAILCLARDYKDLKARLGRIRIGATSKGESIRASDVGAVGGMAVVLREAMLPNLVQTAEGSPALVHGGPFGNIAHGCSSIVATRFALSRAEVVVTEGGFGFDLGAEKFLDIKCRAAGIWPHAMVLVATLRALKFHGGADVAKASAPDEAALRFGFENLQSHARAAAQFGLHPVVAINIFPDDTDAELTVLEALCASIGLKSARIAGFSRGTEGCLELADVVRGALAEAPAYPTPRPLYALEAPLKSKIETIARVVYGAEGVDYSPRAEKDLAKAEAAGLSGAPICMAKTHLSLTADPARRGRPQRHTLPIVGVRISAGAGFVVPLCGEIMTMPGLGKSPAVLGMDLTDDGEVIGLK